MFNIGDEVEIVSDLPYSVTRAGSTGTIININSSSSVEVKFNTLTSRYQECVGHSFNILVSDIKLITPISTQERVIKKINSMYLRQQKRGVVHV